MSSVDIEETSLINLHQSKPASVGGAKRGTGQEAVDEEVPSRALLAFTLRSKSM